MSLTLSLSNIVLAWALGILPTLVLCLCLGDRADPAVRVESLVTALLWPLTALVAIGTLAISGATLLAQAAVSRLGRGRSPGA